jgi:signal transduction histidine kinase
MPTTAQVNHPIGYSSGTGLGLAVLAAGLMVGSVLSTVVVGIPILAALGLAGIPMATFERWRLKLIDPQPITDPHRVPDQPGLKGWLATRWKEAATWREFCYALLLTTLLWPLDLGVALLTIGLSLALITSPMPVLVAGGHRELWPGAVISTPLQAIVAVPAGLVLLVGGAHLVTALATAQGRLTRLLLAPREAELRDQLAEVALSRARLLRAFEAERRRIERDLHDGAQQRLVAMSMSLGLASLDLPPGPIADQVGHAREQAKLALNELRELIHGVYPQILTDRGLPAAAEDAADRSPVPVTLDLKLDRRLPQAIEATGYFVICEALTNIGKHSKARNAWVHGTLVGDTLVLEIGDDGVGGADAEHGTGLAGLGDRVAGAGGTMAVSSPPGGPTSLEIELPCR